MESAALAMEPAALAIKLTVCDATLATPPAPVATPASQREDALMIAKDFVPETGTKSFVIMEIRTFVR